MTTTPPRRPPPPHRGAPAGALGTGDVDAHSSRAIDLQNYEFVELIGLDLQPNHRGGLIRVTGQIIDVPPALGDPQKSPGKGEEGAYDVASIDVRIVGLIGSSPTSLHRGSIGGDAGPLDFVLEHPSPYKRVQVLARLVLDGNPEQRLATTTTKPKASAAALIRMAR